MLKPEQIPESAWLAMRDYVAKCPYGYDFTEAIAAAINAWQGMFSAIRTEEGGVEWDNEGNAPECLVLPLPQEKQNG